MTWNLMNKINEREKQNQRHRNLVLTAVEGKEREWEWRKEDEGTSQRTCMNDSGTCGQQRGDRLWERRIGRVERGSKRGKNGDKCNRINKKSSQEKNFKESKIFLS